MINSSTLTNASIIKYPLITDKATRLLENNQYTFIVDRESDKITIKNTIEETNRLLSKHCLAY